MANVSFKGKKTDRQARNYMYMPLVFRYGFIKFFIRKHRARLIQIHVKVSRHGTGLYLLQSMSREGGISGKITFAWILYREDIF
jgi:hypothetical protein